MRLAEDRSERRLRGAGKKLTDWLAFRIDYEEISESRCRACVELGGTHVTTESKASALADLMRKEGYDEDDFPEVGQFVSLDRCIPDHEKCPRIELDLLNYSASAICMMSLSEGWPSKIAPMIWDAHSSHLSPDQKQRMTSKIAAALSSPAVLEFFRKKAREQNG